MLNLFLPMRLAQRLPIHKQGNYNFFIMKQIKKKLSHIVKYIKKAIFVKDVI